MLRSLGPERFLTLLANWHRGVHGKFKVPVFAHRELDLVTVFWSVMEKGGYEVVSNNKQWKVEPLCCPLLPSIQLTSQLLNTHVHCHGYMVCKSSTRRSGMSDAMAAGPLTAGAGCQKMVPNHGMPSLHAEVPQNYLLG